MEQEYELLILENNLDLEWLSFLNRRTSTNAYPRHLVAKCSEDLLKSEDPSKFLIGLGFRLCLSPIELNVKSLLTDDLDTMTDDLGAMNILNSVIHGRSSSETEYMAVAILGFFVSKLLKEPPETISEKSLQLVQVCLREMNVPSIQVSTYLDDYLQCRCVQMSHELALAYILPRQLSAVLFLQDISTLLQTINIADRGDLRLNTINNFLMFLTLIVSRLANEWLWPQDILNYDCTKALYSDIGMLFHLSSQLMFMGDTPLCSTWDFFTSLQKFTMEFQKHLDLIDGDIKFRLQYGFLCSRQLKNYEEVVLMLSRFQMSVLHLKLPK